MDVAVEFNLAAFTHNVTEDDIRFAFDTARYDGTIDEDESDKSFSRDEMQKSFFAFN